jgi:hypothetical protein
MCLRDVLTELRQDGIEISEAQVRWAITSGKIDRPPLDGSLRFVFGHSHLNALRKLFGDQGRDTSGSILS